MVEGGGMVDMALQQAYAAMDSRSEKQTRGSVSRSTRTIRHRKMSCHHPRKRALLDISSAGRGLRPWHVHCSVLEPRRSKCLTLLLQRNKRALQLLLRRHSKCIHRPEKQRIVQCESKPSLATRGGLSLSCLESWRSGEHQPVQLPRMTTQTWSLRATCKTI